MPSNFNLKTSNRVLQMALILATSILLGLGWFLLLHGPYPLYFSSINWIYKEGGDVFQHQIGWEWFRQEPWHFPLGHIDAYGYPFGTSISLLDSTPLLAIPFKLFSSFLKKDFQFLGLLELLSVIGQMLIGMFILREVTFSWFKQILGASLLVLSPPMIFASFFHDSLTSHWILLAGVWFIFLEYRHKLWHYSWISLFILAILIHPYFVVMLIPLWAISLYYRHRDNKNKLLLWVDVLSVFAALLAVGYSIGMFDVGINNLQDEGFGRYSWNLNAFLNPVDSTSFLKPLPKGPGTQYEGYSYLGIGILPVALILFFEKDFSRRRLFFLLPFVLVSILFTLYALSNIAFVNYIPLWRFDLPPAILKICSYFRASGRFIWPVFYFLVLFGIISVIRNTRFAIPLLFLAVALQFWDVHLLFYSKYFSGFTQYQSPLQSEFWQAAAQTNRHMILIPADPPTTETMMNYPPFALYARQNKMTLNWGYFARADYQGIAQYADQVWQGLKADHSDRQTLYIFWDPGWEAQLKGTLANSMVICNINGFNVAVSKDNPLLQTNYPFKDNCTFP